MAVDAAHVETPASESEVAELLRSCAHAGRAVRVRGGGTKLGWGNPVEAEVELRTGGLDAIVEFTPGDLTALLQPGVRLADAQAAFAEEGLRLSLDPPLGAGDEATIGGVLATADAGPLRHRYGAVRDLVIGVRLALPDGTVVKAGGRVIKNVAGYDLAKLNAGAFGTLGVVVEVAVRLHPLPQAEASATATFDDPDALARAVRRMAHSPLETEALDLAWRDGHGGVIARYGGAAARDLAAAAAELLGEEPGAEVGVANDDDAMWEQQRAFQRVAPPAPPTDGVHSATEPAASANGLTEGAPATDGTTGDGLTGGSGGGGETVVRVSGLPAELPGLLRLADDLDAAAAGRAAVGTTWVVLPTAPVDDITAAVARLRELGPAVVLDAPDEVRSSIDPWGEPDAALLALSKRLKERFDPERVCNPGIYVGGI